MNKFLEQAFAWGFLLSWGVIVPSIAVYIFYERVIVGYKGVIVLGG